MNNIKKVFKIYSPVEYKTIESFLEEMALKGWMFKGVKNLLYTFENVEPIKLHFNVVVLNESDAFDYQDFESENTLIEFCEDSGWTHCSSTPVYQIFYTDKENDIVKIHTDRHEEYKYIKKATIKSDLYGLPLLLMMIFSFFSRLKYFEYDHIFSNQKLISMITPVLAIFLFLIALYAPVVWLIKNKINLRHNKPFTHFSKKFIKVKYRLFYFFMFLYLFLLVISFSEMFSSSPTSRPILLFMLLPVVAIILMFKRFKKVKKSRKSNIIMYISISILTFIISLFGVIILAINLSPGGFDENLATDKVLELSDFDNYKVVDNHLFKKSSIFTPVYLDYYESVRDKNSDIGHISTVYIECRNEKIKAYVLRNLLLDNKKYQEAAEYTPLSNDIWSIDEGYYLNENKNRLLLVKDNHIMIIESDMDFEDIKNIEICKEKLNLN